MGVGSRLRRVSDPDFVPASQRKVHPFPVPSPSFYFLDKKTKIQRGEPHFLRSQRWLVASVKTITQASGSGQPSLHKPPGLFLLVLPSAHLTPTMSPPGGRQESTAFLLSCPASKGWNLCHAGPWAAATKLQGLSVSQAFYFQNRSS